MHNQQSIYKEFFINRLAKDASHARRPKTTTSVKMIVKVNEIFIPMQDILKDIPQGTKLVSLTCH
jgi:hypothetical protein